MFRLNAASSKKLGLFAVLLCTGFLIQQLSNLELDQIPLGDWKSLAKTVIAGGVGYGIISISLSIAWQQLLHWSGEHKANFKLCYTIYGRTQIAKYIPGNIFSIAGRHVLGRQNGLDDAPLYWSAALEILGMVFISALVFSVGGLLWSNPGPLVEIPSILSALLAPLFLPWLMKTALVRIPSLRSYSLPHVSFSSYLRLYFIFLLYLPWLGGAAALLWWIIYAYTGESLDLLIVLGIASGAWLAGYIVPGASGGIGVREALLIVAFKPLIGESIVLITILYRIATVLGDVVFFLLAFCCPIKTVKVSGTTVRPSDLTGNNP
jgi:hypothetical protein